MRLSTVDAFKHLNSNQCITLSDQQLNGLQQVLFSILLDIDEVCREHGLYYVLSGGTALGAVRHQGFIPWDDDIDINMPRADYERFIPLFQHKHGKHYWIHTPEKTDNYGLLLARIRLKGTSVKTREDFFCEECGAFVDIFIIENTFNHVIPRVFHGFISNTLGLIVSCRKFYRDRNYLLPLVSENKKLRKIFQIKVIIGFLISFLSINVWTRLATCWNGLYSNQKSKYVVIPAGRKHYFGELYRRETICKAQFMLFEGTMLPCPVDTDYYLKRLYGSYMVFPKESDREKHIFFAPFQLYKSWN